MSEQPPEPVNLPIRWVGAEEVPLLSADQFLAQFGAGDFILNFGSALPPLVSGTPEEQAQQLEGYTHVPVKVVARVGINRYNLERLVDALQQTLANYDRVVQTMGEQERW